MKTARVWMMLFVSSALAWIALPASVALNLAATSASAALPDVEIVGVYNSPGSPTTDGFYTQDLLITTNTDWLAGNMIVTLSSGSIFQSAFGGNTAPPAPAIISAFPSSAFDTYVSGKNGAPASSAGGAVDIGGSVLGQFDTAGIDINWFTTATGDIGTFTIGRFTLSSDAQGEYIIRVDSAQSNPRLIQGYVWDGVFSFPYPPEPASLSLLGIGALVVLGRNRAGLRG